MKTSMKTALLKYGKLEHLIECNVKPNFAYWRLSLYEEYSNQARSLAIDMRKMFDTYYFSVCKTNNGIYIFIYDKKL